MKDKNRIGDVIAIEGTDKSGKNTLYRSLLKKLLSASNSDRYIIALNFPNYMTPIGTLVRQMNRGYGDSFVLKNSLSFESELRIRKAAYALDRLFNLLVVSEYLTEYPLIISDRFYESSINTHSYLFSRSNKGFHKFIDSLPQVPEADFFLTHSFNTVSLVCDPTNQVFESKIRVHGIEELDFLEKVKPQKWALKGYRHFAKTLKGEYNTFVIRTRENGRWRNISTILAKSLDILSNNGFVISDSGSDESVIDLNKSSNLIVITPSMYNRYLSSLSTNKNFEVSDELTKLEDEWINLSFSSEERLSNLKGKSIDIKSELDKCEPRIASQLSAIPYRIDREFTSIESDIVSAMKRLSEGYSDMMLLPMLEYIESEANICHGTSRLVKELISKL